MARTLTATEAGTLEALLIKTSRTFALSIPALAEPLRRQVTVAYLLFRIADTLEDATEWPPAKQLEELDRFDRMLGRFDEERAREAASHWRDRPPLHDEGYLELLAATPFVLGALEGLPEEPRELIRAHTSRTVECMASFVRRTDEARNLELDDVEDLKAYCYAVAGIVGEMLTELFLAECKRLGPVADALRGSAARFGEALQLVNILKDSAADAGEGRRYLPAGVERKAVFAIARADLEQAGRYVDRLQRAGAPRGLVAFTALPVLLAWRTLEQVEARGPGAKLSRPEVLEIAERLERRLDRDEPAVP